MKNKKGFTLIELLAVIVVLALILVLTIPTVLKTMNDSKKKTFQMFGQKVGNAAMQLQESYELLGTGGSTHKVTVGGSEKPCYTFEDLGITGGTYKGFVTIESSSPYTYKIYLADNNFAYNGTPFSDVQGGTAVPSEEASDRTAVNGLTCE